MEPITLQAISASVEYVESRSQWWVVSKSGCVGVMQVCPQWATVPKSWLFNPAINRDEGNRLLEYWYTKAHRNWYKAVAAYRCGWGGLKGTCGQSYATQVIKLANQASTGT